MLQDERFHTALLASSGNPELVEALVGVNRRIRHVRRYDFLATRAISAHSERAMHISRT